MQFQKISIPTPWKVIRHRGGGGGGGGFLKAKVLEYGDFLGEGVGVVQNKSISWGKYSYFLELHITAEKVNFLFILVNNLPYATDFL